MMNGSQQTATADAALPLAGLRVGLSGAIPEREQWGDIADLDRLILAFVAQFSAFVMRYGGTIVHATHPSFAPTIAGQASLLAANTLAGSTGVDSPLTLLCSRLFGTVSDLAVRAARTASANLVFTPQVGPGSPTNLKTRNDSLTAMRLALADQVDVVVAIGGKLHREGGAIPGVLEELTYARWRDARCFVVASFGGMAGTLQTDVVHALSAGNAMSESDIDAMAAPTAAIDDLVGRLLVHLARHRNEFLAKRPKQAMIPVRGLLGPRPDDFGITIDDPSSVFERTLAREFRDAPTRLHFADVGADLVERAAADFEPVRKAASDSDPRALRDLIEKPPTGSQSLWSREPKETQMNDMLGLSLQLPIVGRVIAKSSDPNRRSFKVKVRSGAEFEVFINATTWFDTVTNLDRLARQRLPLDYQDTQKPGEQGGPLETNVKEGDLIAVEGIYNVQGDAQRYDAMTIHLLKSHKGYYLFEHTNWWKAQIDAMGNRWLDDLFGEKRTYALDDFAALYRTTLNIEGVRIDDTTQEMATLSRLIYGLSSAYLLGGDERHYRAAKAGVEFQREAFRSYSADGRYCLWLHARKRDRHGVYDVLPSANPEDAGLIPLYEQIYALAGLAQYYRVTNDRETLQDIRHTLRTMNDMFAHYPDDPVGKTGRHDGYFSHIDPVTFRWDGPELGPQGDRPDNRAKKNWNSIGDHLPAYLINLILALDPLPVVADGSEQEAQRASLASLLEEATKILEVTSELIREKFPEPGIPYVCERFERDWTRVKNWGWQQNRAIVGHNLKIAWNLTRVANYWRAKGEPERAGKLFELSRRIGADMGRLGIDQVRSGVYDAVERVPADPHLPVQFAWANTKDFWQQEQGILAYLIMFGHLPDPSTPEAQELLWLARELSAVWNLYFIDRERNSIFFRVSDNGHPVIRGTYGDKGGHAIAGYHSFELNYLAHIYQLAYLPRQHQQSTTFCMHFRPSPGSGLRSINVLPDFLGPDAVEVAGVEVDGVVRPVADPKNFQIPLLPGDLGRHVMVQLRQSAAAHARLKDSAIPDNEPNVFEARPA